MTGLEKDLVFIAIVLISIFTGIAIGVEHGLAIITFAVPMVMVVLGTIVYLVKDKQI